MTSEWKEESEVSFRLSLFCSRSRRKNLPSGLRARRVRYQAAPATAPPATAQMLKGRGGRERSASFQSLELLLPPLLLEMYRMYERKHFYGKELRKEIRLLLSFFSSVSSSFSSIRLKEATKGRAHGSGSGGKHVEVVVGRNLGWLADFTNMFTFFYSSYLPQMSKLPVREQEESDKVCSVNNFGICSPRAQENRVLLPFVLWPFWRATGRDTAIEQASRSQRSQSVGMEISA